jgi:molecular chaperone Hsp33
MSAVEDGVAIFQLEEVAVRGRVARLAAGSLDPILRRHDYPRPVAILLGEALMLATLIGSLFKVNGRLTLQAEGDGPVSLLVAEYRMDGALRGYARLNPEQAAHLQVNHALAPAALLGDGALAMTLDQGPGTQPVQGVVALEGASLAACAERYFQQSEQTPTRIRLAVAEEVRPGGHAVWRAGGVLIQPLAGDERRGDPGEGWRTAEALFSTVQDDELVDEALPADRLLYRLFHELGVRLSPTVSVRDQCSCDRGRLAALLKQFDRTQVAEMIEPDGLVHASCQFCARVYLLKPEELALAD